MISHILAKLSAELTQIGFILADIRPSNSVIKIVLIVDTFFENIQFKNNSECCSLWLL